jgi:hypothetical protein
MPRHEEKHQVGQVFQFEIFQEDHPKVIAGQRRPDDPLVVQLKQHINSAAITRRDLYLFIGDGPEALFSNENQAYNLEYGLRHRPTITLDCVRRWLAVLGETMGTYFQSIETGWHDNLVALREAVLAAPPSEELLVLARAAVPQQEGQDGHAMLRLVGVPTSP